MKTGCKSHWNLLVDRRSWLTHATACDVRPGGCVSCCRSVRLRPSASESDTSLGVASVGGSSAGVLSVLVHTVARDREHGVCLQPFQASHTALAARLECLQQTRFVNGAPMIKPAVQPAVSAEGHFSHDDTADSQAQASMELQGYQSRQQDPKAGSHRAVRPGGGLCISCTRPR
jgi:hypothetical protein